MSLETTEEVQKRLAELVPLRDKQTAQALAQAGDLAVPFLKYEEAYSSEITQACVQALIQIGSDAAIEALNKYVAERPDPVLQQLFDAADTFDRQNYFKEIIALFELQRLDLRNISSLEGFEHLTSLTSLSLSLGGAVSDLSPLRGLTNLTSLSLRGEVSDLSPLTNLKSLKTLHLSRQVKGVNIPKELKERVDIEFSRY